MALLKVPLSDLPAAVQRGKKIYFRRNELLAKRDSWFAAANGQTPASYVAHPEEELISINDAAKILSCHPKTLRLALIRSANG